MRLRTVGIVTLLLPLSLMAAERGSFERPGALLLNVTESDLNHIVQGSFHLKGGPNFAGTKRRSSASVSGLTYHATLSEPIVALGDKGKLALSFDVREANLNIAKLERKIAGREATCEDTGLFVDPALPLEVMMAMDVRIQGGDLRFVPENVVVNDVENRLNLVPPSRCTNALLPRWFLWWLGKPSLKKRYIGGLDELLLERAKKSATRMEESKAILRKRWEMGDGGTVHVYPSALDTSHRSLFVSLTASDEPRRPASVATSIAHTLPTDRTYVALSEAFLNDLSRLTVSRMGKERLRPTGNLRKLLRSSSIYALIPGLRGLDANETLSYSVALRSTPHIDLATSSAGDAMLRFRISDLELRLFKGDADHASPLGTMAVKSGTLGIVPYRGVLGGISFRVVENTWSVSSHGIRFDDALVAATLQEIAFGRFFETTYRPLATDHWRIGETGFEPLGFETRDGYLVISLGEPPKAYETQAARAPMQTSTLRGSR